MRRILFPSPVRMTGEASRYMYLMHKTSSLLGQGLPDAEDEDPCNQTRINQVNTLDLLISVCEILGEIFDFSEHPFLHL